MVYDHRKGYHVRHKLLFMSDMEIHNELMRAIGRIEGKIDGILEQATKTNGRVTRLEDEVNTLQAFKDNLNGKITIIAGAISIVVAFVVKKLFS